MSCQRHRSLEHINPEIYTSIILIFRQEIETQTILGNLSKATDNKQQIQTKLVRVLNLQELSCHDMEVIRNDSNSDSQTCQLAPQTSNSQTLFDTPYLNQGKYVVGNMNNVSFFKPTCGELIYICFYNMGGISHILTAI